MRHFKLVARPGADDTEADQQPLILEPYAPPGDLNRLILKLIMINSDDNQGVLRRTGKTEAELLSMPESLQHLGSSPHSP